MFPILNSQTRLITRKIRQQLCQWRRLFTLDSRSRIIMNLALILFLNVVFPCIEWFYGDWNNSWALKADCLRGLFHCSSTLANVAIMRMRQWPANSRYSYGFARAEVLACFAIGLTQIYLALMQIFLPAIPRLMYRGEVGPERMIEISVVGLLLNLITNYVFHFFYRHEEEYEVKTGIVGGDNPPITKETIYSILVDVFGSLALVVSAVQTEIFRSMTADSICSMVIALCMILSVVPMLKETGEILIQRQPVELDDILPVCYRKVYELSGVNNVLNAQFWTLSINGLFVGSLVLEVVNVNTFDPNELVEQVKMIFDQVDVRHLTVELQYVTMSEFQN
ncbi:zinc transporter 7-like [Cotesia glomerata]|uniref:zinc transporter 7-like n=1 Tax=Cotesia glomerata TaxID=32391 RepID=UPI001D024EC3|nr:zinc transporter 7-like [Cotesia glomerata]